MVSMMTQISTWCANLKNPVVLEKKEETKVEGRDMEEGLKQRKQPLVHTNVPILKKVPSPGNNARLIATGITAPFWHPEITCMWKCICFQD